MSLRSPLSDALAPAYGSLEYELQLALGDARRLRDLLRATELERAQWERAFLDAERERRRLEAMVKELEAGARVGAALRDEQEART